MKNTGRVRSTLRGGVLLLLLVLWIVGFFPLTATAEPGLTFRVSVSSTGAQANGFSGLPSPGDSGFDPAISADGRFVAFVSFASNLVAGDTNGTLDIFVHDRQTGATTRVSVSSTGGQANDHSFGPAISANGRFVAFASGASNLVTGDTNGARDIFVHDRQTGVTTRVSVSSTGGQANNDSFGPAISADGRFVAFESFASNLVAGDTNGAIDIFSGIDIFVHDRQTGATTRASVSSNGGQANGSSSHPAISADDRFVAFESSASNLVAGDTNGARDIFVHDRQTGATTRVSVSSTGGQASHFFAFFSSNPAISGDGRFIAFESDASNLVVGDTNNSPDIFVHDRQTGATTRVSIPSTGGQANNSSFFPVISGDGRFVAFVSFASNLVAGDTNGTFDIFVHDRQTGATTRVSVSSAGGQANDFSAGPAISANGRLVAFFSSASNLVSGDTNNSADIFVHDREGRIVTIDIKPGSFPNSINLASRGVIPVAILTTPSFNVADVDPSTVRFAGAAPLRSILEDVDGDGDLDRILHFDTSDPNLSLNCNSTQATLTGQTTIGASIQGTDSVRVVRDKNGVVCP